MLEGPGGETTQREQEPGCASPQLLGSSQPKQQTSERRSLQDVPSSGHLTAAAGEAASPSPVTPEPRGVMIKWLLLCYPIKFGVVCYAVIDNQYLGPLPPDFVSFKAKL